MFSNIRKRLRRTSIATRLVASFGAIIVLLLAVALQGNIAMRQADSIHRANIEYIFAGRELIYRTQGEFSEFRFRLRDSFQSYAWRETASRHERRHYARLLSDSYNTLVEFSDEYIELMQQAPFISYEHRAEALHYMNAAQGYFSRVFLQFFYHFFPGSDHTEYIGQALEYMEYVDMILSILIDLTRISVDDALYQSDAIIERSMNITILLVILAVAMAAILAVLMTTAFTDRVKLVADNVEKLQSGEIANASKSNDELSRIFNNVTSVFMDRERESATRMQAMFDSTPIMIEFWNRRNECIDCNRAVMEFHGIECKEEFLKNYKQIVSRNGAPNRTQWDGWREYIELTYVNGKYHFESTNYTKEGKPVYFETFAYIINMNGEDIAVTYTQDITARQEIEDERRRSALAEENSLAKSRFLARMSHEIRTPLTAVLGISEIQLQNPTISLSIEEAFAKIHNSSNILLSLVNDILDLSRIESGKLRTINKAYELAGMVADVVQMHLIHIGSKKIEFKVDTDKNLPSLLIGDELRIRQILNNLLSNAFKYTDAGEVVLMLKRLPHPQPDTINLQINIRDTGRGMKPEYLQFIMEEYTRFHETELRLVEGTGLGMPIVHNLLQLMGGEMQIESAVGEGTSVDITLPQKIAGKEILGETTAANLKTLDNLSESLIKRVKFIPESMPYGKVLVVDDVDTNLYVARGLLEFYDINISTCVSGHEAIELVKQGNKYDIIFMDQMMPGMNGDEATGEIRKLGYTLPIIALTANALIGQSELFLKNGFDGFLSKPIQTMHLNGILTKFIRDNQPPEVIEAAMADARRRAAREGIRSFVDREMAKLKNDFYSGQKNTAKNIRGALATDDFVTAHRLAHTLKGLAGLIKENALEKIAYETEKLLRNKKVPTNELNLLEASLDKVLAEIEATILIEKPAIKLSPTEVKNLLDKLEDLLDGRDAACLELTDELAKIPETTVLIKLIESWNFEAAIATLKTMREVMEV